MKIVRRYRYVTSYDYMMPLMHIPIQRASIEIKDGETAEGAVRREMDFKDGSISDIEIEEITEQ